MVLCPAKRGRVDKPAKTEALTQRKWELGISQKEKPSTLTDVTCGIQQFTPLYPTTKNENPSGAYLTVGRAHIQNSYGECAFWETLNIKLDS